MERDFQRLNAIASFKGDSDFWTENGLPSSNPQQFGMRVFIAESELSVSFAHYAPMETLSNSFNDDEFGPRWRTALLEKMFIVQDNYMIRMILAAENVGAVRIEDWQEIYAPDFKNVNT